MDGKSALIAGASGLVGNELLQILLEKSGYTQINALVRKPLNTKHPKLKEVLCDFDQLESVQEYFKVDDVFCCLGTTIKKAKTKEAMYRVDVEYPINLAQMAQKNGAQHFLVISSMNANPNSLIWYPKIKGELEEELKRIPYKAISILRPSLLLGNRKEFRLAENLAGKIVQGLSLVVRESPPSTMAIEAKTVALAMYNIAQRNESGSRIYPSKQIAEMSGEND